MKELKKLLRERISDDQKFLKEIEEFERVFDEKDDRIAHLEKKVSRLEYELSCVPTSIKSDAKRIADGEIKMPDGYYRETIKGSANFSYAHKKQC